MKFRSNLAGLLLAVVAGLAGGPARAEESGSFSFFTFAQIDAIRIDDATTKFEVGQARGKFSFTRGPWSAVTLVNLAQDDPGDSRPGTLPNGVLDAFVSYDLGWSQLVAGQTKAPIGMEFAEPGDKLDIPRRGMEKGLDLDRTVGVLLRGRGLGSGFGYDIGLYNPAGRSAATRHRSGQAGEDPGWAARVMVDQGPWHAEASTGGSREAGGPGSADYSVVDAGVRFKTESWRLKAEWIAGRDIRGVPGRDERVWFAHAGYRIAPRTELMLRHYEGESDLAGAVTRLSNTYMGATFWLLDGDTTGVKLQLKYVTAGGDKQRYTGLRGFRADSVVAQIQLSYRP